MIGLSGSHYQVSEAAKNFGVTFVVTKSEDNYTVQHTPSIFLISPNGEVIDVFAMNTASTDIAAAMK
jgi:cytochrome oxidase Cu insertion factor (SCO1/SenC/PrrC family)